MNKHKYNHRANNVDIWVKSIPGNRNRKCKDRDMEVLMLYPRNKNKAIVTEAEQLIKGKW